MICLYILLILLYLFIGLIYFRFLLKKWNLENATHPDDMLHVPIFMICFVWPIITIVQLFLVVWYITGKIANFFLNIESSK